MTYINFKASVYSGTLLIHWLLFDARQQFWLDTGSIVTCVTRRHSLVSFHWVWLISHLVTRNQPNVFVHSIRSCSANCVNITPFFSSHHHRLHYNTTRKFTHQVISKHKVQSSKSTLYSTHTSTYVGVPGSWSLPFEDDWLRARATTKLYIKPSITRHVSFMRICDRSIIRIQANNAAIVCI